MFKDYHEGMVQKKKKNCPYVVIGGGPFHDVDLCSTECFEEMPKDGPWRIGSGDGHGEEIYRTDSEYKIPAQMMGLRKDYHRTDMSLA